MKLVKLPGIFEALTKWEVKELCKKFYFCKAFKCNFKQKPKDPPYFSYILHPSYFCDA